MRILWVCNIVLPVAAKHLNMEVSNKEGWLTGLAEQILRQQERNAVELAVAFPVSRELAGGKWEVPAFGAKLKCFGFYEDTDHPENYDAGLEPQIKAIAEEFRPEVVHCFGTEFPHTLAVTKVLPKTKILVGVQGVCELCAKVYLADLPDRVVKRVTFRDFLRKDSILMQKEKFVARGRREREIFSEAHNIIGRTQMDREFTEGCNPKRHYFFLNETLRGNFYEGMWKQDTCEKYSILLSQGDYPLKGLHYVLRALPDILKKYPETKVYVAGNSIVRYGGLKERLKVSSYGKYIMELIEDLHLEDKVVFLGKLSAEEMKERLLKSHLFVCASTIENSPNSLGEAMLLGVPCVTALVGGIPSLFTAGQDGIGYPGYGAKEYETSADKEGAQAGALAAAVIQMFDEKEELSRYTQEARKHASCTHDGQRNYERLLEVYHTIAGNGGEIHG